MDFDVFWCKMKKRFCLFRFFSLLITFVELKTTKTSRVVKKSVLTRYFLQTRCHLFRFWKITIPVMMGSSISKYGTLFFGIAWKLLSYLSSWWPPIFSPNGAFYRLILQGKKIHTMNQEWDCLLEVTGRHPVTSRSLPWGWGCETTSKDSFEKCNL